MLASCSLVGGSDGAPDDVTVADGWSVEVVRDDLVGPTQLVAGPEGASLYLAELAGDEGEGAGTVSTVDADGSGDKAPLLDGLLTPTGLEVVAQDEVFVQEQATLSTVRFTGEDQESQVLTEGLPDNGRSQGTLSLVDGPDGARLLAISTGTGSGPEVGSSGRLYAAATDDLEERDVAIGFKNAYAHAVGPDGSLYVTEVGDGSYDGEAPPDELNVIPAQVWQAALAGDGDPFDGGWPDCTGDNDPTEEFDVTADDCASRTAPLALFPPRSTPTSVAVTDDGRVLVALWVEGRVVEVDPDSGEVVDVLTGIERPQHLLTIDGGDVLLTVHGSGELWRLTPPEG